MSVRMDTDLTESEPALMQKPYSPVNEVFELELIYPNFQHSLCMVSSKWLKAFEAMHETITKIMLLVIIRIRVWIAWSNKFFWTSLSVDTQRFWNWVCLSSGRTGYVLMTLVSSPFLAVLFHIFSQLFIPLC